MASPYVKSKQDLRGYYFTPAPLEQEEKRALGSNICNKRM